MAKSHPLGGHRTGKRHAAELTGGAAAAALITSFIPETLMTPYQLMLTGVSITAVFSQGAKILSGLDLGQRIIDKFNKAMIFMSVLIIFSGCAVQLGKVEPKQFNSPTGETIVACDVTGITVAAGDADVCRTVSGGKVSRDFSNMVGDIMNGVLRGVSGFFGGLSEALRPPESPPVEEDQLVRF